MQKGTKMFKIFKRSFLLYSLLFYYQIYSFIIDSQNETDSEFLVLNLFLFLICLAFIGSFEEDKSKIKYLSFEEVMNGPKGRGFLEVTTNEYYYFTQGDGLRATLDYQDITKKYSPKELKKLKFKVKGENE